MISIPGNALGRYKKCTITDLSEDREEKSAGSVDEALIQLPLPTNQMSEGVKVALKARRTGLASANENMLTETRYHRTFKCCQ